MSKNLKLSIYTQIKGVVDYEVVSDLPTEFYDDCWNIVYPAGSVHIVKIRIKSLLPQSYLQINKVCFNSIQLNHINLWSTYTTQQSNCPTEYKNGYMYHPGEYILKIRQNPLVHNYVHYFLSISTD